MSAVYLLEKFSKEAIVIQLFLISLITMSYFGYLLIKKKKYGAAKNQIPDNVVRAYLVELISHAEGFKNQLFGTNFKIAAGPGMTMPTQVAAPVAVAGDGTDAAAAAAALTQVAELQKQLTASNAKQEEFAKKIAQLSSEKAALEAKAGQAGGSSAGGGDSKEAQDKIAKLEAKLSEYEVIEDDLANLKKYQQENKQLRAQLSALQGGAPAPEAAPAAEAVVPAAAAPAPQAEATAAPAASEPQQTASETPAPSPLAEAEQAVAQTKANDQLEQLADKVEESLAAPAAGASAVDPAAVAAAQTAAPVSDTPAPAPAAQATDVKPSAAAPAAAAVAAKPDKSDTDLLSEFERMLSG